MDENTTTPGMVVTNELKKAIAELTAPTLPAVVNSNEELEPLKEHAKKAKALQTMIENRRKEYTSRLDDEKKKAIEVERELTAPLKNVISRVKALTEDLAERIAAERRAEEERLRKQAEEAQRKLDEANAAKAKAEAAKAFGIENKELEEKVNKTVEEAAEAVVSMTESADASKLQKVDGVRVVWDFRIIDLTALPKRFMMPNNAAIRAEVQAMKKSGIPIENAHIEGVHIFAKSQVSI